MSARAPGGNDGCELHPGVRICFRDGLVVSQNRGARLGNHGALVDMRRQSGDDLQPERAAIREIVGVECEALARKRKPDVDWRDIEAVESWRRHADDRVRLSINE